MCSTLLLEAKDYQTLPERLSQIAQSCDQKEILSAIARNPNTPTDVLVDFFADYPSDIFNNPILDLLYLENPNF